ncbi:MAG: UUP1 family membrane protein [Gammaproteobacteria bacterium]|nr:UUP1 family membrane protein [Gammaproteobacteria bacterium]
MDTTSISKKTLRRNVYLLVMLLLTVAAFGIMFYKLYYLDYPLSELVPTSTYKLEMSVQVDGHGDDIQISTFLPKSDARQTVLDETNSSGIFAISMKNSEMNRQLFWDAAGVEGRHSLLYSYSIQAKNVKYDIPPGIEIPKSYSPEVNQYLKEEEGVQVSDPLIAKELERLFPNHTAPDMLTAMTTIHRHLQDKFANKKFSGFTDALTALKLGEASCNGKGRLFVALARKMNIPARLVGGLILETGSKRTSHQWVEVYINGHWVPFDTINDHFAEIPANFLTLYYGDEFLFKHTADINFQYAFTTRKALEPKRDVQEELGSSVLNVTNFYSMFEKVGISQDLLKIVLMIPLGAFVVVIFRNVIGVQTFGTFLPALIAAAARESGLFWGLVGFVVIIIFASFIRRGLDWLQLLHSPKMAIMLTLVVLIMLLMAGIGVQLGMFELAHVSLFPIAILAITAERFSILEQEQGFRKSMRIMFTTCVVIAICYAVMESVFLQSTILAFPELLLFVIALNLWLGKWIGMRVSEFYRFRKLIFKGA